MKKDKEVKNMRLERSKGKTLEQSAAAGNMSQVTARKYLAFDGLPSERAYVRDYRTREDIFTEVWAEAKEFLDENSGFEAKTIFEYLQRKYPSKFDDGQLRSFQRKVKNWRAQEGPEKEVYFPQEHNPGYQGQSDFTNMNELKITINKEVFDHLLYHFVLPYSNWETGSICFSESFESLSEGLQNALWTLGGVPQDHRTDRLSAAIKNNTSEKSFTSRYKSLIDHYRLTASQSNPHSGNENGDVEQSHFRLKKAIDQALMLRGSRDFMSQKEYFSFTKKIMEQKNKNKMKRFLEEQVKLKALPKNKIDSFKKVICAVTKFSTIRVADNVYSVPSRLIGEKTNVYLYADKLVVYYGVKKIQEMPRLRGKKGHKINYVHIISSLIRKPGAFEQYQYQSCLFPSTTFRMAYDSLKESDPVKYVKTYLKLLHQAAYDGEDKVEVILKFLIENNKKIDPKKIKEMLKKDEGIIYNLYDTVINVDLASYDVLLEAII